MPVTMIGDEEGAPPFKKLLVANRGEIAIRILRAAAELRISTVAVYTYEDRYSLHRYKADEAYLIGPPEEALRPYLNIDAIIQLAQRKGVEAIHPGYGFLSENVEFAARCEQEGIQFIGPGSEVMRRIAAPMVGGMVSATVLTLIVIPALYLLWRRRSTESRANPTSD